ncbi:MAG: phospholipase D-like domain-containing protein, partial [Burkholderiales bacterium]
TDFSRLNRRMHNKSFTADGQATIIGGRNIGDEYFGAIDGTLFEDLDTLAVGPVVAEVERDFDRYWASASAFPIERIVTPVSSERLSAIASEAAQAERDPAAERYMKALRESTFAQQIIGGQLPLIWAKAQMVSDDPAKVLGKAKEKELLLPKLQHLLGQPKKRLDLVSPYFVPTDAGVDAFAAMAARGVSIRVLTNSLEATDVAPVHAGYAKHRKELLAAGIRLYELRHLSDRPRPSLASKTGLGGSSASSLHAKTFAVDADRAFIGSFNFDPRSARLNTELGFLIDSPEIAKAMHGAFEAEVPARSYEVRLTPSSDLVWIERRGGQEIRHDSEPGAGPFMRLWIGFLSLLPIDWML